MIARSLSIVFALLLMAPTVEAAGWEHFESWQSYLARYRTQCFPPFAKLRQKSVRKLGKRTFRLEGTRLVEIRPRKRKVTRIGVISAPKDSTRMTRANLVRFMDTFKEQGADWIVVNGDLAYDHAMLPDTLEILAKSGLPILVSIGNGESVAPFNDALFAAMEKHDNLFNANFIRRVDGSGLSVLVMPGYYDQNYIHPSDGCHYQPADVQELDRLAKSKNGKPVVVISHGPPKYDGAEGLDVIHNGENVGDPAISKLIASNGIGFGIFGHILEAGGRGVDKAGAAVPQKTKVKQLYVNAGSASAIPWRMRDGSVNRGMAMMLTIDRQGASYEVLDAESMWASGSVRASR